MNLRICWLVILMTSKPQFAGEKVKLSDLCSKGKSSLRQKDLLNDGPYLVYGASGVIGTMSCYQNEEPYVAVVKDGAGVGRVMACKGKSSVLGTMQALLPSKNVDLNYLLHLVRSLKLGDDFSGSTIPHIYFRDYGEREVPAIAIKQQIMIAGVLDKIEMMLARLDMTLKKQDQLVKSRFVEMFGDPCLTDRSLLPKKPLHSFCELKIGPFGSLLHKEDYVSGGFPVVNPSHIVDGRIRTDSDLTINAAKYREMESYQLFKGDVVLGRRGEIGRCAVVDEEGLLCGTGSMILRPEPSLCRSDYLQRVISFPSFAAALEKEAVGVTMKNLNVKIIGSAVVSLPPLSLQEEFADFVAQVDKSEFEYQ